MIKSHHNTVKESLSLTQSAPFLNGSAHARRLPIQRLTLPAMTFHTPTFTWTCFPAGNATSCSSPRMPAAKPSIHTPLRHMGISSRKILLWQVCVSIVQSCAHVRFELHSCVSCGKDAALVLRRHHSIGCAPGTLCTVHLAVTDSAEESPHSSWWPSVPTHRQMRLDSSCEWRVCLTFRWFSSSACVFSDLFLCVFDL